MALKEALLPEFDQEMAIARKRFERVPDDRLAWKPHEKPSALGWLAGHAETLPGLAEKAIKQDTTTGGEYAGRICRDVGTQYRRIAIRCESSPEGGDNGY